MPKSTKEIMARERWATEEAFVKGNMDALDEVFAPDAVFHVLPLPDFKGLKAFKQFATALGQGFTAPRWNWDEVIIEGNTAVQRYTVRMKQTGTNPMFPVPPTGKELVIKGCVVYHLKNGKVVEFFEHSDFMGLLQQLGIVPPMGKQ
jgi:predicted ester cyclase